MKSLKTIATRVHALWRCQLRNSCLQLHVAKV